MLRDLFWLTFGSAAFSGREACSCSLTGAARNVQAKMQDMQCLPAVSECGSKESDTSRCTNSKGTEEPPLLCRRGMWAEIA